VKKAAEILSRADTTPVGSAPIQPRLEKTHLPQSLSVHQVSGRRLRVLSY